MLTDRKRIMVVGPSGAGKSTLARELAAVTGLPLIHLDAHYWRPGWEATPEDEWQATILRFVAGDAWIIDGNYGGIELRPRIARSDAIVFLDFKRRLCLWRVVKRRVQNRRTVRPDVGPGCPERLDPGFLLWLWRWPKRSRPRLVREVSIAPASTAVVTLRDARDVRAFLGTIR